MENTTVENKTIKDVKEVLTEDDMDMYLEGEEIEEVEDKLDAEGEERLENLLDKRASRQGIEVYEKVTLESFVREVSALNAQRFIKEKLDLDTELTQVGYEHILTVFNADEIDIEKINKFMSRQKAKRTLGRGISSVGKTVSEAIDFTARGILNPTGKAVSEVTTETVQASAETIIEVGANLANNSVKKFGRAKKNLSASSDIQKFRSMFGRKKSNKSYVRIG